MLEANMIDSSYLIRNYQHTDYSNYVRLRVEAESLEPSGCPVSPQFIAEHLGRPNYSPVHDLFVIEIAGKIEGYMDITPEPASIMLLACGALAVVSRRRKR